jgi:hypothetical protein
VFGRLTKESLRVTVEIESLEAPDLGAVNEASRPVAEQPLFGVDSPPKNCSELALAALSGSSCTMDSS